MGKAEIIGGALGVPGERWEEWQMGEDDEKTALNYQKKKKKKRQLLHIQILSGIALDHHVLEAMDIADCGSLT